jgi:hypothetical protein
MKSVDLIRNYGSGLKFGDLAVETLDCEREDGHFPFTPILEQFLTHHILSLQLRNSLWVNIKARNTII